MNGLRAVLVSHETVMIFGSNAVFFTNLGEERPLEVLWYLPLYLSCRGGVEHGISTAQADRQRDPERLPLAKQELRGMQGCRMCRLMMLKP